MPSVTISHDKKALQIHRVHEFLQRSTWAANRPLSVIEKSIENSICFGAYVESPDGGILQIAFARVISDCATYAYLCDVFVDEKYRGQGISKKIMEAILLHPDLQKLRRFTLATQNAHSLYAKFGFTPTPPNLFMEILNNNV